MYSPNELRKRTTAALLLANCLFGLPVGLTAAVSPAAAEDATASSGAAGAIRGLIKATQEVTISGGMVSRITVAPFKEGDTFVKGDRLIAFDCTQLHAERDGARAALRGLRVTYQSNVKLKRYGAGGSYAVNTALADVDKAIANIKVLAARIEYCNVTAPFSGRIVEAHVSVHETPAINAPLLRLVNDDELELQFVAPSRWLTWLRPGLVFDFSVDETGKSYPAELLRIGAVVDPGSQTVRLRGRFKSKPAGVLSGMSGSASFQSRVAATVR